MNKFLSSLIYLSIEVCFRYIRIKRMTLYYWKNKKTASLVVCSVYFDFTGSIQEK